MYLELIQHANIAALNMNGKIDLFSLAFGAEKNNYLTNTHTIKNLLCRANKNYNYGGKIMMSEEFILLIYNLAMIDQALEKFEQEDAQ